ncbi:MAG: DUF523 domain-containing protein [Candidatus Omnitrophica bacterium]|nr:DUF523 domain-containing protein [Candidatus Omnitrophota bacterium]
MKKMNYILTEKIRIGISACNFGAKFRYNRAGWDRVEALGRQKDDYIFTPVCPEVLAGLGVPRPPVKLSGGNGDDVWAGTAKIKNRLGRDVTEAVKAASLSSMEALHRAGVDAFLFMEGSPTCGVYRTTLKDKRLGKPPGVFGALLLKERIFLIPAVDLESPWKWWDHTRRLHAFIWLKNIAITSKKDIYEAWHVLKFICQEIDRPLSDNVGQSLASLPAKMGTLEIESWRTRVLQLLRRPSTLKRIQSVMFKHYAHYRKTFGLKETEAHAPSEFLGKAAFVEELMKLERKAAEQGYLFLGRPIAYKPARP